MALNRSTSAFVQTGNLATVNETTPGLIGQVGKVIEAPGTDASPSTKNLAGVYQFVQRATTATAAGAKGNVVYWSDMTNFVVHDAPAGSVGGAAQCAPAGVLLGTYPASGKFGFIQVAGVGVGLSAAAVATTGFPLVVDTSATPSPIKIQLQTAVADLLVPVVGKALGAVTAALTLPVQLNFPRIGW